MLRATSHIGHPDLLQNEVLLLTLGFVKGLLLRSFYNALSGLTNTPCDRSKSLWDVRGVSH